MKDLRTDISDLDDIATDLQETAQEIAICDRRVQELYDEQRQVTRERDAHRKNAERLKLELALASGLVARVVDRNNRIDQSAQLTPGELALADKAVADAAESFGLAKEEKEE